jgi:transcriptional regulator with XRE-family HTH domain
MAQADDRPARPNTLGNRLRELRRRAGLTGTQMAADLGWVQSKISRIENARQLPSADDIYAWARAAGAPADTGELLDLLADVRAAYTSWRQQLRTKDLAGIQVNYDELARDSALIRNIEVSIIPGLLQTAEYARHRFRDSVAWFGLAEDDVAAAVSKRMQRQSVLYDPTKRFEFVITEAALRTLVCPIDVLLGQLDRLQALTSGPSNIRLGILPLGVPLTTIPLHGFALFDDVAIVETYDTELVLRADDAEIYIRIADDLMAAAWTGDAARRLILDAIDSLRIKTPS